jgi:hypothetical protein
MTHRSFTSLLSASTQPAGLWMSIHNVQGSLASAVTENVWPHPTQPQQTQPNRNLLCGPTYSALLNSATLVCWAAAHASSPS